MENGGNRTRSISEPTAEKGRNNTEIAIGDRKSTDVNTDILRKKDRRSNNGGRSGINNNIEEKHHEQELYRRRSASVLEVKEHAQDRLRDELLKAQKDLQLRDEECKKLECVRDQMCEELEELTAKLFEEANKMVQDANAKRMNSEKLLKEANSKIEILQAEVTALKSLVLTSTPSAPNRHLHPQIDSNNQPNPPPKEKKLTLPFVKGHRRSTSHHNFSKEVRTVDVDLSKPKFIGSPSDENREVDPVMFVKFQAWRKEKTLDPDSSFLTHLISEDIKPCLTFPNTELSVLVFHCVKNNTLTIEPVPEKNLFPRKCDLTVTSTICPYSIRLGITDEPWHPISTLARNRIAAVCDFFTYARYITQGLVKSDDGDVYWEVVRLRKQMTLAKLGLTS